MARSFSQSFESDDGPPDPEEWQSLRSELVALLDQVEGQYARARRPETGLRGIAERMKELREQVGDPAPDRHREALRSVKRAVDRFNERDEAPAYPPNPRDTLTSAINEIRARQTARLSEPAPAREAPAPRLDLPPPPIARQEPRPDFTPRFEELARSVGGIGSRLERLEVELKSQRHSQAGIKEIADQVRQVSQVVELLAGAVGETGQVKRLEVQLTSLGKLVTQGRQADTSAITQRLDDVSATVERLADLQIEYASLEKEFPAQQAAMRTGMEGIETSVRGIQDRIEAIGTQSQQSAVLTGMDAIEKSVRNIYDRIDTIEKNFALSPADFEKLTSEMARFTAAMQEASQPQGLLELVDALNSRISDIEARDSEVGGLKNDIQALRNSVVEAVEPRLAAMQSQLEALNERVAERPAEPGVGQLEAQVRQLVARMDQTGEQLTGIARLYSEPVEREPAPDYETLADLVAARTAAAMAANETNPDYEALADLVAARTSEAMARNEPASAMTEGDLREFEGRITRLLSAATERAPADFSGVEDGIRRVDERLERLEDALTRLREGSASLAAYVAPAPVEPAGVEPAVAEQQIFSASAPPVRRSDSMPLSPIEERPLSDRPFPDLGPVKAALEARNGPRKLHPGLSDAPLDEMSPITPEMLGGPTPRQPGEKPWAGIEPPAFDPAAIERPPRPESSFDTPEREVFSSGTVPVPEVKPRTSSVEADSGSSRNTFIEAARRAAQRQTAAKTESGSNSLLGRALARFQPAPAVEKSEPTPKSDPGPTSLIGRALARFQSSPSGGKKLLPGDIPSPSKPEKKAKAKKPAEPAPPPPPSSVVAAAPIPVVTEKPIDAAPEGESFLAKHRQPILLAASVVALSFLTLNLVNQRLAGESGPDTPAIEATDPLVPDAGEIEVPMAGAPMAGLSSAAPARVIPMIDSLATGAIDPAATSSFAPATGTPAMPEAFSAVTSPQVAVVPEVIDSPVSVELPPETLGPLELRQAAADGDARAQFEVAAIYTEGRAVPEDLALAATWYERAAAQGFAPAQYRLGNLYENGRGIEKDLEQARLWYQRAAEAGNRMSMHNLAALYAGGDLGKQEFAAAAEWFEKAAEQGMTDSQFNLGMLYARGLGVPQSMDASYKWFALAAKSGDQDAAKARDDIVRSLDAETVGRIGAEVDAWAPGAIDLPANFAPIGTWAEDFDPGPVIDKREVVLGVQTLLNRLGYDVGTPDGLAGPKTAEAIKSFERATGMSETGIINPRLLAVLGSQPV